MTESAVAAVAAASGDKSCGVESQRADATQGSSVVNDTPNHLHIGEIREEKKNENWKIGKRKNKLRKNKLERAQFNSDAIPTNSKEDKEANRQLASQD